MNSVRFTHRLASHALGTALTCMFCVTLQACAAPQPANIDPDEAEGKAKTVRGSGEVQQDVVNASAPKIITSAPASVLGFSAQTRLGYDVGDQWEPAIASDRFRHVYLLYPQYSGVPGCAACPSPTMILQVSADRGQTWAAPRQIAPPGTGQWDAQIEVDPLDGRTLFAAWLQNNKSDTVVARSNDFGATWQVALADRTNAGTDKPILAVRGNDVYVAFNHAQKIYVATSHDGGVSFTQSQVNANGKFGWSLSGGGTIDPSGNVYFGWAGYKGSGGAKGAVNLFVSKSSDGGRTWTNVPLDTSGSPPDCAAYSCGWAYLGAQVVLCSDTNGVLYALWNASSADAAPNRIYFARSSDGGASWTPKTDLSLAPTGAAHAFPAIAATGNGDVRVAWMDARTNGQWNTFYRRSINGGVSWSPETDLSTYVSGFGYIQPDGFRFPFGDYYEMTIDDTGTTHAIWGEGNSYDSPGSIWYARGQ